MESHPTSPTRRPKSWRYHVTLPGILAQTVETRIQELERGRFSQHGLETSCFDLRIRRAHAVTGQFAGEVAEIQDAIDRFITAHYRPGAERDGGTLRKIIFGTLPPFDPRTVRIPAAKAVQHDVQAGKSALTLSGTFASGVRTLHAQITRSIPDPSKAPEYAQRRDKAREALRYTKKDRAMEKQLREEIRYLSELLEDRGDLFAHQVDAPTLSRRGPEGRNPFAVFYATSRYFRGAGTRSLRIQAFDAARSCAEAFEGAPVALFECANWFYAAQQGAIGTKANSKRLLGFLKTVVETLLPGFSNLRIEPSPPRLFVSKGQTELELGQLSDGERGLLALAFDLTRRLAIANPRLKNPVSDGEAIVLLDEIELHLHPSWQRKVLERLMKTFKSCQFIATTHSPQVLGEAPPKSVWMIEAEDGQVSAWQPDRYFGMDSNRLLEELMGTDSLNAKVKEKLHEIGVMVDDDDFKKAKESIAALELKLGADHPELIRLRSLIAFLTRKK